MAWNKIKPNDDLAAVIIKGVERWKISEQWAKNNGQFIPNPATFLNGERWTDECTVAVTATKNYDDDDDFLKGC